jgi:hypothetical protein
MILPLSFCTLSLYISDLLSLFRALAASRIDGYDYFLLVFSTQAREPQPEFLFLYLYLTYALLL